MHLKESRSAYIWNINVNTYIAHGSSHTKTINPDVGAGKFPQKHVLRTIIIQIKVPQVEKWLL